MNFIFEKQNITLDFTLRSILFNILESSDSKNSHDEWIIDVIQLG